MSAFFRNDLARLNLASKLAIVLEHTAGDAKAERGLVLGFDPTGERDPPRSTRVGPASAPSCWPQCRPSSA
jgi:hypothetical protein